MVIYEVNLNIRNEIYPDYSAWLFEHVKHILQYTGFIKAEIGTIESKIEEGETKLRVSYLIDSYHDLENYLTHHAPKMRLDGIEKFGSQFSAHRRIILDPVTIT